MLTQSHTIVDGFLGRRSRYRRSLIKDSVIILGEVEESEEVKYIHGSAGKGTFTFYGGHDPEDHKHLVHDPPTNLALHPNSPGYRLILNNVLFPAAKKKEAQDQFLDASASALYRESEWNYERDVMSTTDVEAVAQLNEKPEIELDEVGKVIVGQREVIGQMLTALLAGGHCLLVGVPGTARRRWSRYWLKRWIYPLGASNLHLT